MLAFRKKLPSYKMRDEIIQKIKDNQVLVISGETGNLWNNFLFTLIKNIIF